ncbi:MAG: TIGR02270 family protein [Isosphaeraceae bacterium]
MSEERTIIPYIIEEHADEAAFLWGLRGHSVLAPHFTLSSLAKLDNRLEAHVDGLRVAGQSGWEVAKARLVELGGPGEVFAAAVLAFESGNEARIQSVLEVGTATPEASRGLISALGWLPYPQASKTIRTLLAAESTDGLRAGLAAMAVHRKNPGPPALQRAFASDDPLLKARALRAVGELGLINVKITALATTKAKDPACRFWAAWSSALLSVQRNAVISLQDIAEAGGTFAEHAAQMAMRRLPSSEAWAWLRRLVKELRQMRIAVAAAGAFADPEIIPFLIELMKVPKLARVAGESFSLITGADIAYDKLEGAKPEGFEAGPTENPEDENVAMDPDLNLPWPDPALIQKWWNARQGNFARGTRYLLGQPITPESLREALKTGFQRQRAAAALELAILKPGRPLFEVRAPGWRQQAML